jgi:hypothetical protein
MILTMGCGKYRFNKHDVCTIRRCNRELMCIFFVSASHKPPPQFPQLGNIGDTGLPRVLDMGQCNVSIVPRAGVGFAIPPWPFVSSCPSSQLYRTVDLGLVLCSDDRPDVGKGV